MALASTENRITHWLRNSNGIVFTLYAALSAFCLYTCVYAFRKTFSVATFQELSYMGVSYKVWLVTFQVVGYAFSKFIGIKVIAELRHDYRMQGILLMITIAGVSWLLFALVPAPYNIIFLFFNGLPLGMVWGMVFSYLEGRRVTEVLGAALSISFIFSAGLCRSVGAYIMRDWGTAEKWMPFVSACVFVIPLLVFLWLLDKLPKPSLEDEQMRSVRRPMNLQQRQNFIREFLPGIILFILAYMLLTTFRDFRDNFSAEMWSAVGYGNSPGIYTTTEIPISIAILVVMGSVMLIRNNAIALMTNHVIIITGMVLIGFSTLLYEHQLINATLWMILVGLGLYLGYVPFNSIFFDRLIATFNYAGTVGFIMYVADSFGYLGSVGVLFFKEFALTKLSWLHFSISFGYLVSILGTLLIGGSMYYFHRKQKGWYAMDAGSLPLNS